uniref:SAC domain-containing protein n=1 Tax=Heterorhabditis bacteriophora TaxID=37862 RepID=A0A1I7WB64_HETBA
MPGRLRRITVYETAGRFYLVGCNTSGAKFNVLKIDRIDSKALVTGEPECDYSKEEILELLATITEGNSERVSNTFGILGAVRFLEGYYLIVVTKANVVASFGYHSIYKIAEVAMISLAMDGISSSSEEQRYVKLFQVVIYFKFSCIFIGRMTFPGLLQSVDLSTDFYFSYTYDLSRSLQENVLSANWKEDGNRLLNSDKKFVWNSFLLEPLRNNIISERWFLEVVHGYVAFVQRRGSVPLRFILDEHLVHITTKYFCLKIFIIMWSQDPATRGVVGKPLILIDIHEPHAQTAGAHFSLLHEQFVKAINYLNQFLPQDEHICYLSFDVARCNKSSNVTTNVLTRLDEITLKAVQKHGWFQSFPLPSSHEYCPRSMLSDYAPCYSNDGSFILQQGITRTNCVDCLDRTNVAQFGIGKVALACQLYTMGMFYKLNIASLNFLILILIIRYTKIIVILDEDILHYIKLFLCQIHADSRALSVFGINQEVLSNGQFMKLWKNESKDKTKEKGKKAQRESDDDDDEPDEDVQRIEDVMEYEEAWTRIMGRGERQKSKEKEIVMDKKCSRPILATGLSFARDLYALETMEFTAKERAIYEKYVGNGGFRVNEEDWQQNKPTLLIDFHGLSGRQTSEKWRPAFFTTDDIFQTEMPEVSKTSLKFYQKSCDVVGHIPSKIDMATFTKYPVF